MCGFIINSLLLFLFWILLSGHFDFLRLFLGVICSLLVAWFARGRNQQGLLLQNINARVTFQRLFRFITYLPWLFYQITRANIDVALRTLHPKMPISPRIIKFKADLTTETGFAILGNSITLTPGTVTMDIVDGEYVVHALSKESAEGLLKGEMQKRVKYIEGT